MENTDLKNRLEAADERFGDYAADSANVTQTLRQQLAEMQQQLNESHIQLETEKEEKLTALLKNAEISQSEELLKKELRQEKDEANDVHERNIQLEAELKSKEAELNKHKTTLEELENALTKNDKKLNEIEDLQRDISEKNKVRNILYR